MQQILQHQPELAHKLLFVLASTDKELVRHKASGKKHVGQTITHHMNHDKHRPFGHLQRWGSHISAAFSTKHKPHCRGLRYTVSSYSAYAFLSAHHLGAKPAL